MIPQFIRLSGSTWPILPPGQHLATMDEVFQRFAINPRRIMLFNGMKNGLDNLFNSGCLQVFVDGSFVTAKPNPNDYEVGWDLRFVDPQKLDPILVDVRNGTDEQLKKYMGEFYPTTWTERNSGDPFLRFFQTDKETGEEKGIVRILNYNK